MSAIEMTLCTLSLWTCYSQFFFNLILKFVFMQLQPFRLNSRAIKSNVLTKDKIKRHSTKVEKAPQIGDSFKIYIKCLI